MLKTCRICNTRVEPFLSLGRMPIANGFLTPEEFATEFFYDLAVCFCESCSMVQLHEQPEPSRLFHPSYPFLTGTSRHMQRHFTQWAESLRGRVEDPNSFVVEIGSNDGTLLRPFAERRIRHLGIDPSLNVHAYARDCGVQTRCAFFDEEAASVIKEEQGSADLILGANVLCHIANLHSALEGIRILLKPSGWLVFEEPYLGEALQKTAFDQFYDEHVFMFSLKSLQVALDRHGLEIFYVEPQWTHGGSLRYFAALKGTQLIRQTVLDYAQREDKNGLHHIETYLAFAKECEKIRDQFQNLLGELKQGGKQVAGYAATSKSATVLNYCGVTPDLLPCIYDTTPLKQGKYSPGTHIPIVDYAHFPENYPDYAVLFAWNHAEEIFQKEQAFRTHGGKWVRFVPKVEIV